MRFCDACGSIAPSEGGECSSCGAYVQASEDEAYIAGVSRTGLARRYGVEPRMPNGERAVRADTAQSSSSSTRKRAIIDETCPQCGTRGLSWHAVQLRSADEGQTVFLECDCGYTEAVDN